MAHDSLEGHSCTSTEALEPFNCSICLDLVYKPVVQACGHIFCFWCTFHAMDCQKQSQCPICRRPYMYFPRVCVLLHFMLIKKFPEEYERRSREIQLEEEEKQVFSPTFLDLAKTCRVPKDNVAPYSQNGDASNASATLNGNNEHHNILAFSQNESVKCAQGDVGCAQRNTGSMLGNLTVDDFCCALCNGLLYRPVVLNCGEVFCESCLKNSMTSKVLQCPSCRAPHPGGSVLICLELHHYLESAFPSEYSKKQLLQQQAENSQPLDCNAADFGDCKAEGYFHKGVGCDGCGMSPIMGDRYHCKECTDMNQRIGFDLCGSCYTNGGSLMGRFSQEHRANHHMELVDLELHLSKF